MALGRNRGGRFVEDRTTGKWTYIRIMNVLLMKRKVGVKDMSIRKMINRGKILNNVFDFFLSQLSI